LRPTCRTSHCHSQFPLIIPLNEFLAAPYMNVNCPLNHYYTAALTPSSVYDFHMLLQSPEQVQWHNEEPNLRWHLQTHPMLWEISQSLWGLCRNALFRITNERVIATSSFVHVSSEAPLNNDSVLFKSDYWISLCFWKWPYDWQNQCHVYIQSLQLHPLQIYSLFYINWKTTKQFLLFRWPCISVYLS